MNGTLLVIGILLSVVSKWLQMRGESELGDTLVFPAAFFLGLALLFSLPFFKAWWEEPSLRPKAYRFAIYTTLGILSFQLFAWLVFGRDDVWGAFFLLPFAICLGFVIRLLRT